MAQIGLKYFVCAPLDETGADISYSDGMVIAHAIKADIAISNNEANLFGDDRAIESVKEFKDGKLTLNCDHLTYDTYSMLLGHSVIKDTAGNMILIAKSDDSAAYVGVGFYGVTLKNNVEGFRAFWMHKVKFSVPNESFETKGDSTKFGTPTIEGSIYSDKYLVWKEECTFKDEQAAIAWINGKAGILVEP